MVITVYGGVSYFGRLVAKNDEVVAKNDEVVAKLEALRAEMVDDRRRAEEERRRADDKCWSLLEGKKPSKATQPATQAAP